MKSFLILFFFLFHSHYVLANITGNTCENITQHLNKKDKIKITYIVGYKDARPARFVGDRYEKNVIVHKITEACQEDEFLCEFERSEKDAFLFKKSWKGKRIYFRLMSSSVTENDDENLTHPFQQWLSGRVKKEFLLSLWQSDILFYNGHSRSGGGPDFYPPLLKKDKQIDFKKYKNGHGSFKQILNYFKKVNQPLSVLGLFSCKATQHFERDLNKQKKNVLLLTAPNLIYFKEAMDKSLYSLEYLMKSDCKKLNSLL